MKPAFMTIPQWRELVEAAHSGWLVYAFGGPLLYFVYGALACRAYAGWERYIGATPSGVMQNFLFQDGLGWVKLFVWMWFLRALVRTIDWRGKRRLARKVGLLYA